MNKLAIATLILAASTLLSRVLGFLREVFIAYLHGATAATDAYYAAFTLPDLMNYFLAGGALSVTFIPMFSAYLAREDEAGGWRLFSIVATTMGMLMLALTVVLIVFTPQIVPHLFPGFDDPAQMDLLVRMTRIVMPAQLAFYVGGVLNASLMARQIFWPSALMPLVYNLFIILGGVALHPWIGVEGFAVGVVAGAFLGPLAIPLWASRKSISYQFRFAPLDPEFKKFVWVTLPLMIGVSLVTVDEWLLRYFGSMHESGAISWLTNSRKLMMFAFAVIGQAAGQAALPFFARLYHEGKEDELGQTLSSSLQRVVFFSFIASAGLFVVAEPLVFLVFQRGAFSVDDAAITAELLMYFSIGLAAWGAQTLAVRGFYAREDTWTPMIISSVVTVVALPAYWLLNESMGIQGLALATSVGMVMNVVATVGFYRFRGHSLPLKPVGLGSLRGVGLGLPAALGAWLVLENFDFGEGALGYALSFGSSGVVFLGVLLALIALVKPPEVEVLRAKIARKLRRK